jgi:signal transduction histidine kinase
MAQQPLDAVDSRIVFWTYAAMAIGLGLVLQVRPSVAGSGFPATSPGHPYGLVFILGAALIGAGLIAVGLARIEDVIGRRQALGWFTSAHFVVLIMLLAQRIPASGSGGIVMAGSTLAAFLFYAWSAAFGDASWWQRHAGSRHDIPSRASLVDLQRSQLEQQIRLAAAQEERHRLARDLHDSIKQQLFAIQTAAATAETRLAADADGARQAVEAVRASAREAMAEMEAMTDQLRAAPLENAGLVSALRKQGEALGFRTGATVDVQIGRLPANDVLPPGAQQAIFRIAQEALSNVARHARATHVNVSLDASDRTLTLVVADDGSGYVPAASSGAGLENMRARATELGGTFSITRGETSGTIVRVAVPYAGVSAKTYRHKVVAAGVCLAIVATIVLFASLWSRTSWSMWPLVIIPTFELWRYVNAWMRARRMSEARA